MLAAARRIFHTQANITRLKLSVTLGGFIIQLTSRFFVDPKRRLFHFWQFRQLRPRLILQTLKFLNRARITRLFLKSLIIQNFLFQVNNSFLNLLKIIHSSRRRLSVLLQIRVVISAVTHGLTVLNFNYSINLLKYIAVVCNYQHRLMWLRIHPINKLLFRNVIHVVCRLVN